MKVLLLYATYSSGTSMAAGTVNETLSSHNLEVTMKQVQEADPSELEQYDLVVFGSPTWDFEKNEGMPHQHFLDFFQKTGEKKLQGKKFAVFGLGDSSYHIFCGSVNHLEEFVKKLQGTLVVPSLRVDGYFFDQATNNQKLQEWATSVATAASA